MSNKLIWQLALSIFLVPLNIFSGQIDLTGKVLSKENIPQREPKRGDYLNIIKITILIVYFSTIIFCSCNYLHLEIASGPDLGIKRWILLP